MEILVRQEADMDQSWTEHERRRLTRLCAVLTGDSSAAEDLAQETLLEAWRIRDRLGGPRGRAGGGRLAAPCGLGPWRDAIARNVCLRWRVRRGKLAAREVSCSLPTDLPG